MPYCRNCGRYLSRDEICVCGGALKPEPAQPVYWSAPAVPQGGSSRQEAAPRENLVRSAFGLIKDFISSRPVDAALAAARTERKVWIVLLGMEVLLSTLSVFVFSFGIFRTVLAGLGISYGVIVFGAFFYALAEGFGYGLLLRLVCDWGKQKAGFSSVMNLATLSLLPKTAGFAAALCFGFFIPIAPALAASAGTIVTYVVMYSALKGLVPFSKDPVWIFAAGTVVIYFVLSFLLVLLAMPVLIGAIINLAKEFQGALNL